MAIDSARAYLARAVSLIRLHAYNAGRIDWTAMRTAAAAVDDAMPPADRYTWIRDLLMRLGDQHSFLLEPGAAEGMHAGRSSGLGFLSVLPEGIVAHVVPAGPADQAGLQPRDRICAINTVPIAGMDEGTIRELLHEPTITLLIERPEHAEALLIAIAPAPHATFTAPTGRMLGAMTAIIEMPSVIGEEDGPSPYASAIQALLIALRAAGAHRWIVDLRRNTGGNLGPMLAGIGPLLGTEEVGGFRGADGQVARWLYTAGAIGLERWILTRCDPPHAPVITDPVVVLTSGLTRSSGELTLVAFRGRPRTHTLGMATGGVPTSNEVLGLPDGAELFLMTALGTDRTGASYDAPILPDEPMLIDWLRYGMADDPVIAAARGWLSTHS